jgi:hypothetical protein
VFVCCAVLLVRGVRCSFVVLFAASAVIQLLVRLSVIDPAGDSHVALSRNLVRAAGVISALGILLYIAGWISLTRFVLKSRSKSEDDTSSV